MFNHVQANEYTPYPLIFSVGISLLEDHNNIWLPHSMYYSFRFRVFCKIENKEACETLLDKISFRIFFQ